MGQFSDCETPRQSLVRYMYYGGPDRPTLGQQLNYLIITFKPCVYQKYFSNIFYFIVL